MCSEACGGCMHLLLELPKNLQLFLSNEKKNCSDGDKREREM